VQGTAGEVDGFAGRGMGRDISQELSAFRCVIIGLLIVGGDLGGLRKWNRGRVCGAVLGVVLAFVFTGILYGGFICYHVRVCVLESLRRKLKV
jgi:hypothetical protein